MRTANRERPWVIGHRGAAARAPENTAASLRLALESGVDAVEIDVGLTLDGRAAVLHDRTLDRTTSGRGRLIDQSWERVRDLDAGGWFSPRFESERVLDLDAALAIVRGRAPIVIELKSVAGSPSGGPLRSEDLALLEEVLRALGRTGGYPGVTLSSSAGSLLETAAARAPGLDLALTVPLSHHGDPVERAVRIGVVAIHPHRLLCGSAFVARAQAASLAVFAYTVNHRHELAPLLRAGVDGVFSDDPARVRRFVERAHPAIAPRGPFALGIDQGSSGTRAVLLSADDRVAASASVAVASRRLRDGTIVQDAEAIAASVVRAAVPLIRAADGAISGVGIASQRSSVVFWRRADRRPVEPLRSWRSAWNADALGEFAPWEPTVRRVTGLTSSFPYGAIRIAERIALGGPVADGLRRGRVVAGPVAAFLGARLGGAAGGAIDPSLAQRMLVFDLRGRCWSEGIAGIFGVPLHALPSILPSRADRGRLRLGPYRPPLRAIVGDVGAAFRAIAGPSGRGALLVIGTGGFIVVGTGKRPVRVPGLLTTLLWEDERGPRYAVEGTIHGVAGALKEAAARVGLSDLPFDLLTSRSGSARRRPRVLAAPEGTGTPHWDPRPRFEIEEGSWSPDEVVAGTLDGIAESFGRVTDRLRAKNLLPHRFLATGGLSVLPHLTSAIERRIGTPVVVDRRPERAAVGAALLAR